MRWGHICCFPGANRLPGVFEAMHPHRGGNPMIRKAISWLALSLPLLPLSAFHSPFLQAASQPRLAAEYYAAPYGTPGGDGSYDNPWDLATALAQPPALQPGDTLWLLGGYY